MRFKARSASPPDAILVCVLAGMVLLAWWALWLWGRSPYGHLLVHGSAHFDATITHPRQFAAIFVGGWTLMTVAMMMPTSLPLIVLFHRLIRDRKAAGWLVVLLICGYIGTWVLCGVLLQLAHSALQGGLAHVRLLAAAPWIGGAIILVVAGLYQFSSLKYACLEKCRSPLLFLTSRWRGGNESVQALRIGVEHGLFCVGCCWSLMLLMFVVSTGSLSWMLLLGVVMALEKNFSWGSRLSSPLGVLLLVEAGVIALVGIL